MEGVGRGERERCIRDGSTDIHMNAVGERGRVGDKKHKAREATVS